MLRLIETGWACVGALASKVTLLARNRVISSVILPKTKKPQYQNRGFVFGYIGNLTKPFQESEQALFLFGSEIAR